MPLSSFQRKVLETIAEGHPLHLPRWQYTPPYAYVGRFGDIILRLRSNTFRALVYQGYIKSLKQCGDMGESVWGLTEKAEQALWNPPKKA